MKRSIPGAFAESAQCDSGNIRTETHGGNSINCRHVEIVVEMNHKVAIREKPQQSAAWKSSAPFERDAEKTGGCRDCLDDGYPPGAVGQPFHPVGGDAAGILLPDHADFRQEKLGFKGQHHVGLQGVGEPGGDEGIFIQFQPHPVGQETDPVRVPAP